MLAKVLAQDIFFELLILKNICDEIKTCNQVTVLATCCWSCFKSLAISVLAALSLVSTSACCSSSRLSTCFLKLVNRRTQSSSLQIWHKECWGGVYSRKRIKQTFFCSDSVQLTPNSPESLGFVTICQSKTLFKNSHSLGNLTCLTLLPVDQSGCQEDSKVAKQAVQKNALPTWTSTFLGSCARRSLGWESSQWGTETPCSRAWRGWKGWSAPYPQSCPIKR